MTELVSYQRGWEPLHFGERVRLCQTCFTLHAGTQSATIPSQRCDCSWRSAKLPLPRRIVDDMGSHYRLCWCCAAAVVHGSPTSGAYVCGPCLDDLAALHRTVGRTVVPVSPHADHDVITPRRLPGRIPDEGLLDAVDHLGEVVITAATAFAHRQSRCAELVSRSQHPSTRGGLWQHLAWCSDLQIQHRGIHSLIDFATDPEEWRSEMPEHRQIIPAG